MVHLTDPTQMLVTALAVVEECEGSIEGMLEQINIHLGANTFHIYPEVGPKKIRGRAHLSGAPRARPW